ncbi:unnamed protein product [Calypogeia fissa]
MAGEGDPPDAENLFQPRSRAVGNTPPWLRVGHPKKKAETVSSSHPLPGIGMSRAVQFSAGKVYACGQGKESASWFRLVRLLMPDWWDGWDTSATTNQRQGRRDGLHEIS